jgi:hypothetical protein
MYAFTKNTAGRFIVYSSFQRQGDTHLKRFGAGVTPQNQQTVNIYAKGAFTFQVGALTQQMPEGSCTLDLQLEAFPEGAVATETVVSPTALRYCVAPSDSGPFTRQKLAVSSQSPASFAVKTLVFVLSGTVTAGGVSVAQGGYLLVNPNSPVTGDANVLALA